MADNTVNFKINIGGNAIEGVMKLTRGVEETTSKFSKLGDTAKNLANIGFVVSHVTSLFRAANAVVTKYTNAYKAQAEAETKLSTIMRRTIDATDDEIASIKALASEQQRLGVIGDEVQLAGAQELATYVEKTEHLKTMMPVLNDMLAQQYGYNATQESAVTIAQMMGKVLDGQVGALSRYGYSFDKAQEKILKFGNDEERVAMLSEVITQYVGGVNEALAQTPEGKQKQIANDMGDIDERVGSLVVRLKSGFNPVLGTIITKINKLIDIIEEKNIIEKVVNGIEKLTKFIGDHIKAIGVIIGLYLSYA